MVKISRLKDISIDKSTVLTRILENQNICKAVKHRSTNFLDQPIVDDPYSLIYTNIFPYKFVPGMSDNQDTYITMSFRRYRPVGTFFKSGLIYINVFTHQNLYSTDYGVLRPDYIISEIDEIMNQQSGIGLGKPEFYDMDELYVNEKYSGLYIAYKLYEFN